MTSEGTVCVGQALNSVSKTEVVENSFMQPRQQPSTENQ